MKRRRQEWRGSVFRNSHGTLCLRLKVDGAWVARSTKLPDTPENWIQAHEHLAAIVAQLRAREVVMVDDDGPPTVAAYFKRWLPTRKGADAKNDAQRMRDFVLPILGRLELTEVRPRQVLEVINGVKEGHAPRTVRNVYSVLKAFFRDAAMDDLMSTSASPCILTSRHLGKVRDSAVFSRDGAVFERPGSSSGSSSMSASRCRVEFFMGCSASGAFASARFADCGGVESI